MNTEGQIIIVAAPSGAGKTSLVNALVERVDSASLSISHTTRPPRPGEEDGRHYHFIDHQRFETLIQEQAFLEHAEVFGNYYGTSFAGIAKQRADGQDVILEIDWQGARQVKQAIPEAISIFILPPSRDALERRLRSRGQDSDSVINRRMAEARDEASHYAEFDYLVVNEDFETALADLISILRARHLATDLQRQRHQQLIDGLLA
jgi:guanylate kinase